MKYIIETLERTHRRMINNYMLASNSEERVFYLETIADIEKALYTLTGDDSYLTTIL